MPKTGSRPSRRRYSLEAAAVTACLLAHDTGPAAAQDLRPYTVVGDAIPAPLVEGRPDPARGRAIVANRQRGLCLLCHTGPFPEERFQGTLAPDLSGAGERWTEGQLRLRLADGRRINADTIMPSYYRIDGLARVGPAWRDKPILSAEEIENVVAFLMTLRPREGAAQ